MSRTVVDVEGIVWTETPEDGWWMGECGCIASDLEEIKRKHGPARLVTIEVAEERS